MSLESASNWEEVSKGLWLERGGMASWAHHKVHLGLTKEAFWKAYVQKAGNDCIAIVSLSHL